MSDGYQRGLFWNPGGAYLGLGAHSAPRSFNPIIWASGYGPAGVSKNDYAYVAMSADAVNLKATVDGVAVVTPTDRVATHGYQWGWGPYNGLTGLDPEPAGGFSIKLEALDPNGAPPSGTVSYAGVSFVVAGYTDVGLLYDTFHGPENQQEAYHTPDIAPDPGALIAGYQGRAAFGNVLQSNHLATGGNEGARQTARIFAGALHGARVLVDAVRNASPGGTAMGVLARVNGVAGNTDAGVDYLAVYAYRVSAALVEIRWERMENGAIVEGPTALGQVAWADSGEERRLILELPTSGTEIKAYVADAGTGDNEVLVGTAVPADLYDDAAHVYVGQLSNHYTNSWWFTLFQVQRAQLTAPAAVGATMEEGAAPPAALPFDITSTLGMFPAGALVAAITYPGLHAGWLAAAFTDPVTPTTVVLTFDAGVSELGPGVYPAVLALTSALGVEEPVLVTVTLTVMEGEGQPCELRLHVYEEDGETVAFTVSTEPSHPRPLLVLPEKFEEQQIDVAGGKATIGTVTVTVVDRPVVAGDQDGGFLTSWLSRFGLPAIAGHRCRLRRYVPDVGWRTVMDGPASMPKMDGSYAAFSWEIRDWRDVERKLRCFDDGSFGATAVFPQGALNGYGHDAAAGTYLVDPATPLVGKVAFRNGLNPAPPGEEFFARPSVCVGFAGAVGLPGPYPQVYAASWQAMQGQTVALEYIGFMDYRVAGVDFYALKWHAQVQFGGRLRLRWRVQGTTPWHEIAGSLVIDQELVSQQVFLDRSLVPSGIPRFTKNNYDDLKDIGLTGMVANGPPNAGPGDEPVDVHWIVFGDSSDAHDVPALGQTIELVVISDMAPCQAQPVCIEGITAGQFAKNTYDGLYSARDSAGAVVASGIRYDSAALLQMTEPVRIRLTEPITDAREWLEKHIYAPLGWLPALNSDGEISPVSQVPPEDPAGLPVINDTNSEPSPDWDQGDQVVNRLTYTYARDYIPADPRASQASDGVCSMDVIIEYDDVASARLFGEQEQEVDGTAFRALTARDDGSSDEISAERGWILADLRQRYLGARYARGAAGIKLRIMQEEFPTLRAGSWVLLDLSWVPDPLTQRRGLLAMAQVISLGDLDCAWREALCEVAVPVPIS